MRLLEPIGPVPGVPPSVSAALWERHALPVPAVFHLAHAFEEQKEPGKQVDVTYCSLGQLAKKVRAMASGGVSASVSVTCIERLAESGRILARARAIYLQTDKALALVAPTTLENEVSTSASLVNEERGRVIVGMQGHLVSRAIPAPITPVATARA